MYKTASSLAIQHVNLIMNEIKRNILHVKDVKGYNMQYVAFYFGGIYNHINK